jgi:hypothetical protein
MAQTSTTQDKKPPKKEAPKPEIEEEKKIIPKWKMQHQAFIDNIKYNKKIQ